MKTFLFLCCSLFFLNGCSGIKVEQGQEFVPLQHPQRVFVMPFTTVMVPDAVSQGIFDRFIDNLNQNQETTGLEFVILKQAMENISSDWLGEHAYVTGEISAYVEDQGSTTVSLRAKTGLNYYAVSAAEPQLKLSYPAEIFYEKDYQTIEAARGQLIEKLADQLSQKLLETLVAP